VVPWLANHPTRQIPFRRFIRVHYPARGLDEAVIELSGRPRMSLRDLTLSFDGIVVPDSLYAFDAATEEGEPPVFGEAGPAEGVPVPTGFAIEMQAGTLRAVATWTPVDSEDADSLTYELEWQKDDLSEPPVSLASKPGETAIVTGILTDGVGYNFRLRTLSNGATSAWTAYINLVAVADPVAPGVPTDFASTISGSDVTLYWVNPNSANFHAAQVWRSNTNDFSTAILMTTLYGGPGLAKSWVDAVIGGSSLDYFWWVRSINASGTASAPVGPETHFIA
jgi:hypothetical protein